MRSKSNTTVDFKKAKEEKTILTGFVHIAQEGMVAGEESRLILECAGKKIIINEKDVELPPFSSSLASLVGQEIKFVVTEYAEEVDLIFGSNKLAYEIERKPILEKLHNGESVRGIVTKILNYGAYINCNGVSGFIKNSDFSTDGTCVKDVLSEGEYINVKLRYINSNGRYIFEPTIKKVRESNLSLEDFRVGQCVAGRVVTAKLDRLYVNIAPGIDCLCSIPQNISDVRESDYVRVKIIKVDPVKNHVRAVIFDKMDY